MELATIRVYLKAIQSTADTSPTFCDQARALLRELSQPEVVIHERLTWIDRDPQDVFELYIQKLVTVTIERNLIH